jgi:hypothetical protein
LALRESPTQIIPINRTLGSNFAGIAFPFIGAGLRGGPKPRIVYFAGNLKDENYDEKELAMALAGLPSVPEAA